MSLSITSSTISWNSAGNSTISGGGVLSLYSDDDIYLDTNTSEGGVRITNMPGELTGGQAVYWKEGGNEDPDYRLYVPRSSKQYKENIISLNNNIYNLDTFMKMKPVLYTVKNLSDIHQFIGFIAEDLHDLNLKELVSYKNDLPEAVHYERTCCFITKIVQEQQKVIDIQTQQIKDLITTTEQLKKDLEILQSKS